MQKITILLEASQAILSTFDLDEVLRHILTIMRDHFQLQNAAVLLLDEQSQELYPISQRGWDPGTDTRRLPLGVGLTGTAAATREAVYAADVTKDPRYVCSVSTTRSELAIPLTVGGKVVGVLDCQSDKEDFLSPETIDLLKVFSSQASIAIQNARLRQSEQRRAAQMEAINAISRQATGVLDREELLQKVCSLILQSFPVDQVSVLLLEEGKLVMAACQGRLTVLSPVGSELPPLAGLPGQALAAGAAVVANEVTTTPGYVALLKEARSEICVPMLSLGNKIGVLVLDNASANVFDREDVAALEAVADIFASAIQNVHYVEQVKQLAYLDGLTGIFNRRYFELRITEEIERASRYSHELSVVMVDIDHFKRINDEFGHLLGDEVLRQIGRMFSTQLRKPDVLCRYGGEEFALLLPEATPERATSVAEKLRHTIERYPFPGVPRPVTLSAGIASFPGHGTTRDELVQAADAALYAAKQAGRNRVLVGGTRPPS